MRARIGVVTGLALALTLSGCGAVYYGAALGIIATQKDKKVTDISFPDAVPTADAVPAFGTLVLSATPVTFQRDLNAFNPTGASVSTQTTTTITDHEVLGVEFPAGYGEALSNRDAGTTLGAGDRIVLRVDGDLAQAVTFAAGDAASVGTAVAAAIQAKVRALTPQATTGVTALSYTGFTVTFDTTTGGYHFRSGAAGATSAVVLDPEVRAGTADAARDAASDTTAARLGLGVHRGGIEAAGVESVGCVVLNRGTDVIPAGANIELWLSHDKALDPKADLLFDRMATDAAVQVGEARRFTRKQVNVPPSRLVRGDVTQGNYYVLFNVAPAGEQVTTNNLLVSSHPVEVVQPIDDPATTATETANALDIVLTASQSPIAIVTSDVFTSVLSLTNYGPAVPAGGVVVDVDACLAAQPAYQEPAAFLDPAGTLAGVRINPTDPSRPIKVRVLQDAATPTITSSVSGTTITVLYNPAASVTVQQLSDRLDQTAGGLVDAFTVGTSPQSTFVQALLTAAGKTEVDARTLFAGSRAVTFPAGEAQRTIATTVEATLPAASFRSGLLPIKLFPCYRARPRLTPNDQNQRNDQRVGANFVRIYDRSTATFDSTTGAVLPTRNSDDFAALDAVTLRPVNTGSIRQGQQRVFRFEIPDTLATVDESQLLVILRTGNFDAHLDLLNASGRFVTGSDDSGLGSFPVLYLPVQASTGSRSFYLVVSPQRPDESDLIGGGESFELTISVNARQQSDPALAAATNGGNVVGNTPQRYVDPATSPRTRNDVLMPLALSSGKAEVNILLPQRARVRFTSRPAFSVTVKTVITAFVANQVPDPVDHQAELDEAGGGIVYRPPGGITTTSHILEAGAYTFAVESTSGVGDGRALRLELDTQFIPPED